MIMELPKKFTYKDYAKVENGVLYIDQIKRLEEIMYELTYTLRKHICIYCGNQLKRKDCTLDHRYPRATGGVSIVNNLFITCYACNSKKDNLSHYEFLKTRNLHDKAQKKLLKKIRAGNSRKLKRTGFILPKKWVQFINISKIQYRRQDESYSRKKRYYKVADFWNFYHKLPRPIILDKNYVLLDGYNIIVVARDFNIETIPAIILENVEVLNK